MRLSWSAVPAVLLLVLWTGGCGDSGSEPVDIEPREAVSGPGFRARLPTGWREHEKGVAARVQRDLNRGAPAEYRMRVRRAWATAEPQVPSITAAESARPLSRSLRSYAGGYIALIRRGLPKFDLVMRPRSTALAGERGLTYDYTGEPYFAFARSRVVIVPRGRRAFVIVLSARASQFRHNARELSELLRSWKWTSGG